MTWTAYIFRDFEAYRNVHHQLICNKETMVWSLAQQGFHDSWFRFAHEYSITLHLMELLNTQM